MERKVYERKRESEKIKKESGMKIYNDSRMERDEKRIRRMEKRERNNGDRTKERGKNGK